MPHDFEVPFTFSHDSVAMHNKFRLVDDRQSETILWNQVCLALVIEPPLFASRNTRYCFAPVEDRDRLSMLLLLELDDEILARPVSIYRQLPTATGLGRQIAEKPRKETLSLTRASKNFATQIHDVVLVTFGASRNWHHLPFEMRLGTRGCRLESTIRVGNGRPIKFT